MFALMLAASQQQGTVQRPLFPAAKELRGTVTRLAGDTLLPVSGTHVVLHRVGDDTSGVLDSVVTNASGQFRVFVRPYGSDSAFYFLSSSHAGIAYFSGFYQAHELDSAAVDLTVYDTTSARVPLTVAGRHLVVFAPVVGGRGRRVVEVYELSNDSTVTRVPGRDSAPTWRATIPRNARDFGPGPSAISPEALKFGNGELRLFAPLPPGTKQISFAYTLPDGAFPLLIGMESEVGLLEVLLAEPGAKVYSDLLKDEGPVNPPGGGSFRRYVAQGVPPGSEIRVTVPAGLPLMIVLLIVGVGMLVALAFTFRKRTASPALPRPLTDPVAGAPLAVDDEANALARRIADLDAAFNARKGETDAAESAAYTRERNELKKQLAALLARRGVGARS